MKSNLLNNHNKLLRTVAWLGLLCLASLTLHSCSQHKKEQPEVTLKPSSYKKLPGWGEDDMKSALSAFNHSCKAFLRKADDKPISPHEFAGTAKDWKPICHQAKKVDVNDPVEIKQFFETAFKPVEVKTAKRDPGLFTGYFEPTVYASRKRHGEYQYPLYTRPRDLVNVNLGQFQSEYVGRTITGRLNKSKNRLLPYYSREQINNGALAGKNLEILWVNDRVDRFFLEIQGSGRAILDTGEEVRVLYNGKNGLSYTTIGRVMIKKGYLKKKKVSMQSIREYFDKHPEKIDEILNHNKSFVFFKLGKKPYVYGSQNVPLTPERSLAVDKHYLPLGIPIWLKTKMPQDHAPHKSADFQRLMIAQDTGGMIRGPIRGDIFWGHGETAQTKAGHMKYKGHYWLLLPKNLTV